MKLKLGHCPEDKRGIYAISKPAKRSDIAIAEEMIDVIDASEREWAEKYGMKAWAIAHPQLTDSREPLCIFVVHPSLVAEGLNPLNAGFPSRMIFNAQILEAEKELVTYKNVRKTVFNPISGRREIHDKVAEKHTTPNIFEPQEGCMSFVHRKPKKVQRVYRITVRYWFPRKILGFTILWRRTEKIEGLKSQIFQHEIQHFEGANIFHKHNGN